MLKIDARSSHPLYGVDATRSIEQKAQSTLPAHTLMQRAGLAVAQLALALAPHAKRIWIACGPGNNGGDGLEAAMHLQQWGKQPIVTWLGTPAKAPQDAATSYERARCAGVTFVDEPPEEFDLCIDALLGIGVSSRPPEGRMADWIARMNSGSVPVLSIDLPTGLQADTGVLAPQGVIAQHTLSLLTLKPGLFTAQGRDTSGAVWLDDLGVAAGMSAEATAQPSARLTGVPTSTARQHATHKGSYGDVAVIGGAKGMTGAALLAASAALHAGAGRVFVGLLDDLGLTVDTAQPELMFRAIASLDFASLTVVCGCGGGDAIRTVLPRVLSTAKRLVLDADSLNAIAADASLSEVLIARLQRNAATVLTPHPLEAARLLGISAAEVQQNRLLAATQLTQSFKCTVVLKGSGSVIASPGQIPAINPTGNAKLATAGTGDVLAGMVGARLAAGQDAFGAACDAVYRHGLTADQWQGAAHLTASLMCKPL